MPVYDLNGKVALVTGGARGIGFETARQMHARGASVAVVDLDADQAREAAERIGERALGIGADVTDAGAMLAAVAQAVERFGGLDLAMANAGIAPEGATTRTMPPEEWEKVIDVNLLGVWNTVRAALPQVSERNGQIVLVASVAAFMNGMMLSPYAASKAAVEALGRPLRVELAPFGASATVAYFGWVDTEMVRQGLDREQGGKRMQELLPKFFFKRIRVEEAGAAVVRGIEERAPRVSRRNGGATSPPCAASSTPFSTGASSAMPRSPAPCARPRQTPRQGPRPKSAASLARAGSRSTRSRCRWRG